ncbi:PREDICTED: RING-H2 finger protein ATL29 [Tarenaya hassleriana]|uniref:RING-H2 finger protein ATL29 n=1 Tax=Tarenaya hassleriana TaxID=28532 RepID=UPI00053C3C75|nr:PREDICTED: RING-H2 finger protein ATL29 [Tarenaya hassleriana]
MSISPPSGPYTPHPQPQPQTFDSPPLPVILTVILLVFFFIGFFILYFCKCFLETLMQAWCLHRNPPENVVRPPEVAVNNGLDPQIIRSFPSFPYSSVKDLRSEKYGLECAICLLEFSDEHVLRLLTTCYHVFHQECIDLWLESHRTCPVCRRDLESSSSPAAPENEETLRNEEIIIDVIQENGEDNDVVGEVRIEQRSDKSKKGLRSLPEKFPRSHSTGHSIVRNKPEEEDRYTLRLPEHVKIKIARGHNQTESCITFGELTRNNGCPYRRFGEVSGQSHTTLWET